VLQENHYYPFGMLMEGIGTAAVTQNKYKYNEKELNDDLGLNLSDYGARWYDAAVGRWWNVDPLAEIYTRWNPYHYSKCNPIRFLDYNGMNSKDIIISYGKGADKASAEDKKKYEDSILKTLQNLTNDKLSIKDGKVVIEEKKDGDKKVGTGLICGFVEGFIKDGKIVKRDISIVKADPSMENATTIADPNGIPKNASDGVGTDSKTAYDPDNPATTGYYSDDSDAKQKGTPEMILSHELVHAMRIACCCTTNY
jgi:RHS repeat-associated protein